MPNTNEYNTDEYNRVLMPTHVKSSVEAPQPNAAAPFISEDNKVMKFWGLPETVKTLTYNYLKDRPLSHIWNHEIARLAPGTPARVEYEHFMRARQGEAAGMLTKLLLMGLMAGGAYGAASYLPKILKTRKAIRATAEDDILEKKSQDGGGLLDFLAETLWGSKPTRWWQAQGPGVVPPGAMIPAGVAVAAGGIAAGAAGLDFLTDSIRARMLKRRKAQLRAEFEALLQGSSSVKASALHDFSQCLDELATWCCGDIEKRAGNLGVFSTGMGITLFTILALSGLLGGYHLSKQMHPNRLRKLALEEALRRQAASRPVTVGFDPTMASDHGAPVKYPALASRQYRVPIVINPLDSETADTSDEAQDLSKLSAVEPKPLPSGPGFTALETLKNMWGSTPVGAVSSGAKKQLGEIRGEWDKFKPELQKVPGTLAAINDITARGQKLLPTLEDAAARYSALTRGWDQFRKGFGQRWAAIRDALVATPGILGGMGSAGLNYLNAPFKPETPEYNRVVGPVVGRPRAEVKTRVDLGTPTPEIPQAPEVTTTMPDELLANRLSAERLMATSTMPQPKIPEPGPLVPVTNARR